MRKFPQGSKRKSGRYQSLRRTTLHIFLGFITALCIFFVWVFAIFRSTPYILPGVSVSGVEVGGETKERAVEMIRMAIQHNQQKLPDIAFTVERSTFATPSASLGMRQEVVYALDQAFSVGRSFSLLKNVVDIADAYRHGHTISAPYAFDGQRILSWAAMVAKEVDVQGTEPSLVLRVSGNPTTLSVIPGKERRVVDTTALVEILSQRFQEPPTHIALPVVVRPALTPDESITIQTRAKNFVGKSIVVRIDSFSTTLKDKALIDVLALPTGFQKDHIRTLAEQWQKSVERPAQEPKFVYDGKKVTTFDPPIYGRTISVDEAVRSFTDAMHAIEYSKLGQENERLIEISVEKTYPKTTLNSLNTLGINEQIGYGDSLFYHSIPTRVHNVVLTAQRIDLSLVAPGETFSFNVHLGDVSGKTGFQRAYVIQEGRTVLGDGGGVCQVSSTVFRAVLDAGLPIVERHGHSYRVGYYEQNSAPGFDATVFAPSVDFKFKNDTPTYILIHTIPDAKNLSLQIELWGTKDGRTVEISEQKVWDNVPPRSTIYQDDPSLPPGVLKQVDWSAPGAKASFKYVVKRNNEVLQDQVFKTTYQPWAAVYLRGI